MVYFGNIYKMLGIKHLQHRQWDTVFVKARAIFNFLFGSPDLWQIKVMNCIKGFLKNTEKGL